MKKNILITGSAGFLGSNLIRGWMHVPAWKSFHENKWQLSSVDRINHNIMNSIYSNKNHAFYPIDICDQHAMEVIFKLHDPSVVIHIADENIDSANDPNSFLTTNVVGTQVILNCCLQNNVKKIIYISTDKVYGHLKSEDQNLWTENDALIGETAYTASKISAELLIKAAHNSRGSKEFDYNIIRMPNLYGPRQSLKRLIPKTIKNIVDGNDVHVYNQGEMMRDWLHVFDASEAILSVLKDGQPNECYNASAGQEFSTIEVVQEICNKLQMGHELIKFIPANTKFRRALDSTKLKALGWCPQMKFKSAIGENCVEWYINNKWFLSQQEV